MASSYLWPTIGPHLVLFSLLGLLVALAGLRFGPRMLSGLTTVVTISALLVSAAITAHIMQAIFAAGGSANPVTGLWLTSFSTSAADAQQTYTTADGQPLQAVIYRPADASHDMPVMLYLHGGGWIAGSADDIASDLRWFADRGWLVISVDYRLATETEATWDKAPQDVACALVWAAKNVGRFGGNAERLVLVGDSAGGNLAINIGYSAALGQAQSGCGGIVPVPDAVVVQYPVVDPQDAYHHGYAFGVGPQLYVARYIGGSPDTFPDLIRAISSATYLSDKAPPTLIIEPERDGRIPSAGVFRFAEQARAAGVDITLVHIPFANHAYNQLAASSIADQGRLTITQHYLVQRGMIENHD
jgi:acetyl esterase/lipase